MNFENIDLSGSTLLNLDSVPSTNDVAIEAARVGAQHGFAVIARMQTAGRGRRGHTWISPDGSLYLSCVLRPPVPMHMLMGLPAVVGLGVLDALDNLGLSGRVGLKWPNDIVAVSREITAPKSSQLNRKLVGILVEARSSTEGAFAVAGIGLNIISPLNAPAPSEAEQAAINAAESVRRAGKTGNMAVVPALDPISLEEALPQGAPLPERETLAHEVRDAIMARVDRWSRAIEAGLGSAGPLAPMLASYEESLPMLGKPVRVIDVAGQEIAVGYLIGVDAWGRAVIKTNTGDEHSFSAEQVSLRLF